MHAHTHAVCCLVGCTATRAFSRALPVLILSQVRLVVPRSCSACARPVIHALCFSSLRSHPLTHKLCELQAREPPIRTGLEAGEGVGCPGAALRRPPPLGGALITTRRIRSPQLRFCVPFVGVQAGDETLSDLHRRNPTNPSTSAAGLATSDYACSTSCLATPERCAALRRTTPRPLRSSRAASSRRKGTAKRAGCAGQRRHHESSGR